MIVELRIRRGTTTDWAFANPVLSAGEPGYDSTKNQLKIGDGVTAWTSLPFQSDDAAALQAAVAHVDQIYAQILANYGTPPPAPTYAGIIEDASDPGTYLQEPANTNSAFAPDSTDTGFYVDDPIFFPNLALDPNDDGFFITN